MKTEELEDLVQLLHRTASYEAQKQLLASQSTETLYRLVDKLKDHVDWLLRAADGIPSALHFVELIFYVANLTGVAHHRAIGLRAKGNIHLNALYEPEEAMRCYHAAVDIYRQCGDPLEEAHAQVGIVGALARLGKYERAEALYGQIHGVFQEYSQWVPLGKVTANLAIAYRRLGDDRRALDKADQARAFFCKAREEGERYLPIVDNNRALSLQILGRFEEAIQASQSSWAVNMRLGQTAESARARQATAFTYFLQGQYGKSLRIYDEIHQLFVNGNRLKDALISDLENSYCLLQLRRFEDVINICNNIETHFEDLNAPYEIAQAYINHAVAYASKRKPEYEKAIMAIGKARTIFDEQANQIWIAKIDLQTAIIMLQQGQYHDGLAKAQSCAGLFREQRLPAYEAHAWLIAARSALALDWVSLAERLSQDAFDLLQNGEMLFLQFQLHHLRSKLALQQRRYQQALAEYESAIATLELLRGRMITEFTAGFLEDKQLIYEEAALLSLCEIDDVAKAWTFVERAKSRALVDLLAYRIDLRIHSRDRSDDQLVQELTQLQAERNQAYRLWQVRQREHIQHMEQGSQQSDGSRITKLEEEIEQKWHALLKRNGNYAQDSNMATVSLSQVQSQLPNNSCLLEYFIADTELYLFWITAEEINVVQLGKFIKIERLLRILHLNLTAVPQSTVDHIEKSTRQAQQLLHALYEALIAPVLPKIEQYTEIIFVPYRSLHSLPFHALYDGATYLLERFRISYLPSASVLPYCQRSTGSGSGALVLAHTQGRRLPGREREGEAIAALTSGTLFVDEEATLEQVCIHAPTKQILHLATHGEYRADNPLFSGLVLEDGILTTLDIFNLQLNAALVTLSACETAGFQLGGGDELLGLSRAFLSAGAASLVISHWRVEDLATEELMKHFYQNLIKGCPKNQALCEAQQLFINGDVKSDKGGDVVYQHPYFWSAFFLMGDSGLLPLCAVAS